MENNYKIYAYVNKINGKIYIGQTKQSLNARAGKEGKGYRQCVLFYNAISKYGFTNFIPIVLIEGLNKDTADYLEISLIEEFNSTNPDYGYNISKGGQYSTNGIDISGQRFGKLIARHIVDDPRRGRYWYCDCDCGGHSIVRQEHLRDGTTTACTDCTLNSLHVIPNKIEIIDDNTIKVLMTDGSFLIDSETYNNIKQYRWYRSGEYGVSSTTEERKLLLKYLFPSINRNNISRYVKFKDNNRFNYCKDNLYVEIPKNASKNDWYLFLNENNTYIHFIRHSSNRPWRNVKLNQSFHTYNEAKLARKECDIDG